MQSPFEHIAIVDISGQRAGRADKPQRKLFEKSIETIGLLQAPVVSRVGREGYRLLAGAGRIEAARAAGLERVWCLVFPENAESPKAKLAFLHENLRRTELTKGERDSHEAAAARLEASLDPASTPKAKQVQGGKKAGRGRSTGSPKSGTPIRPSKAPDARRRQDAVRRDAGLAPSAMELYVADELKQSQVDELVKVKDPELQADLAEQAVGMTLAETKALVQAAKAELGVPKQQERDVRALVALLKQVESFTHQMDARIGEATKLINRIPGFALAGISGWVAVTQLILSANNLREFSALLRDREKEVTK